MIGEWILFKHKFFESPLKTVKTKKH